MPFPRVVIYRPHCANEIVNKPNADEPFTSLAEAAAWANGWNKTSAELITTGSKRRLTSIAVAEMVEVPAP